MQSSQLTPTEAKMQADYDAIAKAFALSRQDLHWPEVDREIASLPPGSAMLDVGCGMGRLYQTAVTHGLKYTGIDISSEQVQEGKRLHPQADLRQASMLCLPFPDATFDAVFLIASFHHLATGQERLAAAQEACRVLKPGGKVVVTVMALWSPKYWKLFFQRKWGLARPRWNDVSLPWKWKVKEPVYRYYHAFRTSELASFFPPQQWEMQSLGYINNGRPARPWQAKNLVLVAKKSV